MLSSFQIQNPTALSSLVFSPPPRPLPPAPLPPLSPVSFSDQARQSSCPRARPQPQTSPRSPTRSPSARRLNSPSMTSADEHAENASAASNPPRSRPRSCPRCTRRPYSHQLQLQQPCLRDPARPLQSRPAGAPTSQPPPRDPALATDSAMNSSHPRRLSITACQPREPHPPRRPALLVADEPATTARASPAAPPLQPSPSSGHAAAEIPSVETSPVHHARTTAAPPSPRRVPDSTPPARARRHALHL